MLSKDSLNNFLNSLSANTPVYVAYSGGLDSHVLMHLLSVSENKQNHSYHSLHVNHNLVPGSSNWAEHCTSVADSLGFEHRTLEIVEKPAEGESVEAWARDKRYALMAREVGKEGLLLTAHHQNDQAETLLLQLFRGSGVSGLAAMPSFNSKHGMFHGRPLLEYSREDIRHYAEKEKLHWIDDDSNLDISYDRNFLRQKILPLLHQRWPGLLRTLSRVTAHQAEAMQLLKEVAVSDLQLVSDSETSGINISALLELSAVRKSNILRYWIKSQNLPAPATVHLRAILDEVISAKTDRSPLVNWPGCEIRRHGELLYAMAPIPEHDAAARVDWPLNNQCHIAGGCLTATKSKGEGISASHIKDDSLQVRFRQGGEKICLVNDGPSRELKKIFQESRMPEWLRDKIPLLYYKDKLVAVADFLVDANYSGMKNDDTWRINWEPNAHYANMLRRYHANSLV